MLRIIIIRHGETDHSLQNRYSGFSDPPLNDRGIWQAEKLAYRMRNEKVDIAYSSDLKRAHKTANIIFTSTTSLWVNKVVRKMAGFREMNFGIFEGLTCAEIIKRRPKLYKNWMADPFKVMIPGAEGLKQFCLRVRKSLSLILSRHKGGTIALVTHAGPIRVILCDALNRNMEMFWKIEQDIGALNILEYYKKLAPTVIKMNDTSHLR